MPTCPQCRSALVTHLSKMPWCPGCLWNIDAFEPGDKTGPLRRLYRRIAFRAAFKTFRGLQSGDDPARGSVAVVLAALSIVIAAMLLGILALGVWLCVRDFPSPTLLLGVPLVLLVVWLRPRFDKIDPTATVVTRAEAPALFALIDRVAAGMGTRAPERVELDTDATSEGAVSGWRRRRILRVGVPGWLMCAPQERVALLAFCLAMIRDGHAVSAFGSQLARRTFGRMADVFIAPPNPRKGLWYNDDGATALAERLAALLMLPIAALCWGAELAIWRLASPGLQSDHYRDDKAAAAVAGGEAMRALLDKHLLTTELHTVASSMARRDAFTAPELSTAATEVMARQAPELPALRQYSIRFHTTLYDAPALGFRIALLADLAPAGASVTSTLTEAETIDAELAPHIKRMRSVVAQEWYN